MVRYRFMSFLQLSYRSTGRTRFAQARAELGMTDRTGGPTSSNYAHRRRPEDYAEDEEAGSDGEEATALKARYETEDDEAERS